MSEFEELSHRGHALAIVPTDAIKRWITLPEPIIDTPILLNGPAIARSDDAPMLSDLRGRPHAPGSPGAGHDSDGDDATDAGDTFAAFIVVDQRGGSTCTWCHRLIARHRSRRARAIVSRMDRDV
jgi:hypothetical protein